MDPRFFVWSLDDDEARGIDDGIVVDGEDDAPFVPSFGLLPDLPAQPKQENIELQGNEESKETENEDKYLTPHVINLESDDEDDVVGDDDDKNDALHARALTDHPRAPAANVTRALPTDAAISEALARFGHTALRGLQEPALRSVFAGKDTIVLLPTGGGKSLCFQLPALLVHGLVVVISPLLALMQDQVVALRKHKIRVEMLCSLVSPKDKRKIHDRLHRDAEFQRRRDRIEILYTTPETLRTFALQQILKRMARRKALALLAVDEAHCISSWGHDFRPAYLQLGSLRASFPDVPIMALTATATDLVRQDIHTELQLRPDTTVLCGDFNRVNISYTACDKDAMGDPVGALLTFITRCHLGSVGIVYVHRRLDTEALVEELMERDERIRAAPYHAEIPLKRREKTLLDWLHGKLDIICATIAFGMGIDHPSVRFVVHWNIPKSLENLYQESGRAGRDGKPSHHVLLYSHGECENFREILHMAQDDLQQKKQRGQHVNNRRVETLTDRLEKLRKVMDWATQRKCRRQQVLAYFGQKITKQQCYETCDFCSSSLVFDRLQRLESYRPESFTYRGGETDEEEEEERQRRRTRRAARVAAAQQVTGEDPRPRQSPRRPQEPRQRRRREPEDRPRDAEEIRRFEEKWGGSPQGVQLPSGAAARQMPAAPPFTVFQDHQSPQVNRHQQSRVPPRSVVSPDAPRFGVLPAASHSAAPLSPPVVPPSLPVAPLPMVPSTVPPVAPRPTARATRFESQVPAGARTIRDYIAATEQRRTAYLRSWEDPNHFNWRAGVDDVDSENSEDSERDEEVQWVKTETTTSHTLAASPSVSRPAKRRRSSGETAASAAAEIIVIDSD